MEKTHTEMKKITELARKANEQKYESHSKETLKRHIKTKFRTTMIGSLSKFEEIFGYLWGHNIPDDMIDDELSEEQEEYRKMWNLARTEILNNGNSQLRAALSEIDQYKIKFNKMEYKFVIQKGDSNE